MIRRIRYRAITIGWSVWAIAIRFAKINDRGEIPIATRIAPPINGDHDLTLVNSLIKVDHIINVRVRIYRKQKQKNYAEKISHAAPKTAIKTSKPAIEPPLKNRGRSPRFITLRAEPT
jgi:hypothetical protein